MRFLVLGLGVFVFQVEQMPFWTLPVWGLFWVAGVVLDSSEEKQRK